MLICYLIWNKCMKKTRKFLLFVKKKLTLHKIIPNKFIINVYGKTKFRYYR